MDVRELVQALLQRDTLAARQWVADATRAGFDWSHVSQPEELDATEMAVAAAVTELMATRANVPSPAWTASVSAAPQTVFLVRAAETMPRLRRACEVEGPEPFRRRNLLAPAEFLTQA